MNKKQKNNNKVIEFRAIWLVLIIIGIIVFINSGKIENIQKSIEQKHLQAMEQEEIEKVGQNGIVTEAAIISRKTGTGPFDDDDEPGNDSSEGNNIVRSFDQITWTIENTMKLKNAELGESYKGGVIQVRAELPENIMNVEGSPKVVEWDLDSMGWAENAQLSDNGRVFTAEYTLPEAEVTVPGKQTLVLVLKVLGAPNGLEIAPKFTMNLVGNTENEKYVLEANEEDQSKLNSIVKVSAAPSLNVQLKRNSNLNYKSYFDESTGEESEEKTQSTTFGRMQGYGLTLQLYNTDSDKKLKGVELPKGDISFDITFNEAIGTTDVTEETEYTPKMWDYKENLKTPNTGKNGRNLYWLNDPESRYGANAAPYNKGSGVASCYNGGNWTIIQDENKPYIYHITVAGYKFNGDYNFPSNDSYSNTVRYYDNVGCFSSGYIEAIMQIPERVENVTSIYMKATTSNISFKTISDQIGSKDEKSSDNIVNTNINISANGSFSKNTVYERYERGKDWNKGNEKATIGFSGYISAYIAAGASNDNIDGIYGVDHLVKFDDEAIELRTWDKGKEYTGSAAMSYNILYVAKSDKTGWTSDQEMIDTTIDELVYFDTLDELNQSGYICVGYLAESKSGKYLPGNGAYINIPYNVKNTAEIGKVYQTVSDARIYNQQNIPDRTTQTHLLTTNKNDYPQVRWSAEGRQYVKTAYDENGQIVTGTHYGGTSWGDSLLVIGAEQKISIKAIDGADQEKVNYDFSRNENVATFKVEPSLTVDSVVDINNVTLKITTTLPDGLKYQVGSANSGEPEITENADGTQTLVWYKYGCKVNEQIEPIKFNAEINEELSNGTQLEIKCVMNEELAEGEQTKIGNTVEKLRTTTTSINIINLASYSLYKTTETPIIEKDAEAEFTVTALNKTDEDVNTFQLLDVLPYNGDQRGSSFSGDYKVKKITLKQTNTATGEEITNDNLKLYTSSAEEVKTDVTAKDTDLGTTGIWNEEISGNTIDQKLTGFSVVGKLPARTKLTIEITIKTNENEPLDTYQNAATAQINIGTEEIVSPTVKVQVVKRTLDGKIWFDSNKDGVINSGEEYLSGVIVTLLNEDGTEAKDIDGNEISEITTENDGYYKFENMVKGKYKVQITYYTEDGIREVTTKKVGSNIEINSKFNSNGETDIISGLDSILSPELKVEYQNAGITYKDTKVIVHHYIDGTTDNVPLKTGETATDETIEGKVKDSYTTSPVEVPEYYELVANPTNASGEMTKDEITVTYYYKLKKYPYTVKYIDKDTNKEIKTAKTEESKDYGTEITVASEKTEIEKYTYTSAEVAGDTSKNKLTIGTEIDKNLINLYYTKKTGKVVVKYVDKNTGKEIKASDGTSLKEEKTDKVDESYTTTKKEIKEYTFVEDTGNTTGIYTIESSTTPIEVIYYYKKNTKVTAKYIDKATGEEIPEANGGSSRETKDGLEGDSYRTTSKNFENYVLVEEELPTNSEGTMTANEITVIYYYKHISGGVIEKHIDDITGEILYNETHTGNEGDSYNIKSKPQSEDSQDLKNKFEGYELIQEKNPTNSSGIMTINPVEVIYYYRYPTKVTVRYIDQITGNSLTDNIIKQGYKGEDYTTENKQFEGYDLVEEPDNANGTMTKDEITVNYYYIHKSAGVIVNYYDVDTGEKLKDEQKIEGHQGDEYRTTQEVFEGYEIVKERLPQNATGIMTIEEKKVDYYYKKKTKVKVEHKDKTTGMVMDEEIKNGYRNDEYQTEQKAYSEYDLVADPENAKGTMTEEDITVTYYYIKKAEVETLYLEEGEEKELAEKDVKNGHIGDKYETSAKEIDNYIFVKSTENTSGEMGDEKITVKYYYRQKIFNLKVEKWVDSVKIDEKSKKGQTYKKRDNLYKLDIHKNKVETAEIKVTYKIRVTNTGEIAGIANEIKETIPEELEFIQSDNEIKWDISGTTLKTTALEKETIEPGEYKEIEITLRWKKGDNNLGEVTNKVELSKISNQANFKVQTEEDTKAESKMIITVSTGLLMLEKAETKVIIATIIFLVFAGVKIVKKKRV